jgi:NAD(P)-dependent dehydrogenase (short-subunit alcohol dehydrogenase family)
MARLDEKVAVITGGQRNWQGLRTGFAGHFDSACKGAVIHLTRSVAMELGPLGIRVNSICPGGIVTSIFGRGLGLDQDGAEALGAEVPALV